MRIGFGFGIGPLRFSQTLWRSGRRRPKQGMPALVAVFWYPILACLWLTFWLCVAPFWLMWKGGVLAYRGGMWGWGRYQQHVAAREAADAEFVETHRPQLPE